MRKLKRNIIRMQMGSNNIRRAWRRSQIKKYGMDYWLKMYRLCVGRLMKQEAYL